MNIVKSFEESGLLIKLAKQLLKDAKEQKEGFLGMLLVTLAASVLGSDRAFINLDKYKPIGTHWIALYVNAENVTYFEQKNNALVQNRNLLKSKKLKEIVRNKSTDSK